ncbi:hypothetical protein [Neisseria shayeganii]|uniref:hypothetical protein n=1 Tax=Neisseria shayeganii TaxID=607712 RepID=UPI0012EA5652|nr:hypothetical protein [Neisseria shayeganii]
MGRNIIAGLQKNKFNPHPGHTNRAALVDFLPQNEFNIMNDNEFYKLTENHVRLDQFVAFLPTPSSLSLVSRLPAKGKRLPES